MTHPDSTGLVGCLVTLGRACVAIALAVASKAPHAAQTQHIRDEEEKERRR